MRRIFYLVVIIVLFNNNIIAQADTKSNKDKIQYLHSVEAKIDCNIKPNGYMYEMFKNRRYSVQVRFNQCLGVGLHELHGVQFNPHLSLSAVIGVDFLKLYPYNDNTLSPLTCPKMYVMDFLLGLNFKYTILKQYKWSPLLVVEACPISAELYRFVYPTRICRDDWQRSGLYSFSMGAQCRFKDRQSVYAALGYEAVWSQLFLTIGVRLR
ncbi:MAG: hypothetical protein K5890_07565 [Bacteroidales bacterium]|nr:hypothetical protein [Bacteroidales bacterium]